MKIPPSAIRLLIILSMMFAPSAAIRACRRVAIFAMLVALGLAPVADIVGDQWVASSEALTSSPALPGPVLPEQEDGPSSTPVDDDLAHRAEVAGWEALPRRGAVAPSAPPTPRPFDQAATNRTNARRAHRVVAGVDRVPICTRLCRLTC